MSRRLLLSADDYGLSAPVARGILDLLALRRLGAVSCLVNMPLWPAQAPALCAAAAAVAGTPAETATRPRLGLHFNLTEGRPLSAALAAHWPRLPRLPQLLLCAHLRRLPLEAIAAELQAQFAAFAAACGRAPDHLDGHQHVHHLPGVRDVVRAALATRPGLPVRHTGRLPGPGFALKRWAIVHSGGRTLGAWLDSQGRALNHCLLGVHDFAGDDYRSWMQRWLAALPAAGGMVFCHPGHAADADADPYADAHADPHSDVDAIAAARPRELAYLAGPDFIADLRAADVVLAA